MLNFVKETIISFTRFGKVLFFQLKKLTLQQKYNPEHI